MGVNDKRFAVLAIKHGLIKRSATLDDLYDLECRLGDSTVVREKQHTMPNAEFPAMLPDLVEVLQALTPAEVVKLREELAGVVPFAAVTRH